MDRRELDGTNIVSAMCNPCPYDGDCEQCKKDMYQKYGEDVAVKCVLCGGEYKINMDKANYAHKFGANAGLSICPECKDALEFAKEMKKMCQRQTPVYDDGRYICPNCHRTLISVAGQDDKGRLGLKFCINCGQAVKWE